MLQVIIALFIMILTPLIAQENKIHIEPINLADHWQSVIEIYHDPQVLSAIGLSAPPNQSFFQHHKERIQREQLSNTPITTYQIILTEGIFTGLIMLCPFTDAIKIEISYVVHPNYQRKGYGKIAVNKLCTEILPGTKQLINLWACMRFRNIASQKILSFCGFMVKDVPNLLDNEDIEYELQIN